MATVITSGTRIDLYEIDGPIGAGSMGDVFRAHDASLNRPVAVKILNDKHRDNDELRARFVREARACAAISHANVVQVFTTGKYDDRPYIAMEFLDGVDLGTAVAQGGKLASLPATRAVLDAARGLEAAARAGLIHRDVKPSNLVQLVDGTVKVTDFGLAKPLDTSDEPQLTALGVVVGTPDYIAPEQARGEKIDERVDIYALGGTLFYLLTGMPPYRTGDPNEDKYLKVVARHLRNPVPDPRQKSPRTDPELAELMRTMMAKKPAERPDYAALISQLEGIAARLGGASGAIGKRALSHSGATVPQPTPFIGGDQRLATLPPDAGDPPPPGRDRTDDSDAAATAVRPSARHANAQAPRAQDAELSFELPPVKRSRFLMLLTVLSAMVFAVGLGLRLAGPLPASTVQPATGAGSGSGLAGGATPTDAVPSVRLPVAPDGMVLVLAQDGSPWFFVDQGPVTHGEYAKVFPKHKPPKSQGADKPVADVAYTFAEAYAATNGKRLPRPAELEAARKTAGVLFKDELAEWVDNGQAGATERMAQDASGTRSTNGKGDATVTFRGARDVPAD